MALTEWTLDRKNEMNFIEPGRHWQNGCVESFHNKLRKECLNRECFLSLAEARVVLESWRREFNEFRPLSSLGDMTPAEFAICPGGADSATLRPPRLGSPLQPPTVTSLAGQKRGSGQVSKAMTTSGVAHTLTDL